MKQEKTITTITEEKFAEFFNLNFEQNALAVKQNADIMTLENNSSNEVILDNILIGLKLLFLYVPGAMAIHFVGMFIKFLILYGEKIPIFTIELSGIALVGTFLTMLGIGKLNDLSYLKVPAVIFATSFLISILHAIFTIFFGVETEGIFWLVSFPIAIISGYLAKILLDKK